MTLECAWCHHHFKTKRRLQKYCGAPKWCHRRAQAARQRGVTPAHAVDAAHEERRRRYRALVLREFGPLSERELALVHSALRLGYRKGYRRGCLSTHGLDVESAA